MRTIVSQKNISYVTDKLNAEDTLVFDVETTGLYPYQQANMFSVAMADLHGNSWYFNFNYKSYKNFDENFVLSPGQLEKIVTRYRRVWIAHNAKFDLHFMRKENICPVGVIIDTKAYARLFENCHHPWVAGGGYSLDACAKRWLGEAKDDRVKTWMDEHQAYSASVSASGRAVKDYHFEQVPFEIISEYAMIDAEVTAKLYNHIRQNEYETSLWDTEAELTSVLFEMESRGILMDRDYIRAAQKFEKKRHEQYKQIAQELMPSGVQFSDHANTLAPILEGRGFTLPRTDKGNFQINDDVFKNSTDDLAKAILGYRDSLKRYQTYWTNYLFMMDEDHVIHTSFDQSGTVTGRMSCREPNLQNIPNEESDVSEFPVRRAFIARPGFKLVSMDYKAIEFRLALEYAGETELIEMIRQGHDPHQAAADMTGLSRKQAKVFNFATLYGAGLAKIGDMLGCSVAEARLAKANYFDGLPRLKQFIYNASNRMKSRGYVVNAYGRRMLLDDPNFSYKATNCIIQGTAADVMKRGTVSCARVLNSNASKSRMLLTIHDEIIFEIEDDEHDLIPRLKLAMEDAYTPVKLPMECSVEIGSNLHDMGPYAHES